jgi:hypothetical protein
VFFSGPYTFSEVKERIEQLPSSPNTNAIAGLLLLTHKTRNAKGDPDFLHLMYFYKNGLGQVFFVDGQRKKHRVMTELERKPIYDNTIFILPCRADAF